MACRLIGCAQCLLALLILLCFSHHIRGEVTLEGPRVVAFSPPKNLSDIYHGSWKPSAGTSRNITNSSLKLLGFDKSVGSAVVSLTSSATELQGVHTVKGEFDIANGNYSTVKKLRMEFQGVYSVASGMLFIILNPRDEVQVYNYSVVFNSTEDIDISLSQAFEYSNINVSENNSVALKPKQHVPDSCAFKGLFRATSLEKDHADRFKLENEVSFEFRQMIGLLKSEECGLVLEIELASLDFEQHAAQASSYVILSLVTTGISLYVFIKQMEFTSTNATLSKVSMLSVSLQAIAECFLCLTHLLFGLAAERVFNAFALLAFLNFAGFSIFHMRYLLMVWNAQRPANANNAWESVRQELSVLYLRFYAGLLVVFIVMYYMNSMFKIFLFVAHSFWIPQIVANARHGTAKPFLRSFVIITSTTRLVGPAYFFLVDPNLARVEPHPTLAALLALWVLVQAMFLLLQDRFGARFFVPKGFMPVEYNYLRPIPPGLAETRHHHLECVICMAPVEHGHRHMITPCNHVFHKACLVRWLEFKLECPTCRRSLPAISDALLHSDELTPSSGDPDIV